MTRIGTHAVTAEFGINASTAGFGMLVFFKHHHTGTLAQNKTIAVFVPRAGCGCWIVIAG